MEIKDIRTAIVELEEDEAKELVQKAMDAGMDAKEVLEQGVMDALKEIGDLFGSGEYFLAELMIGGKLADQCMAILDPYLPKMEGTSRGTVVIGAVQGDLHDIGFSLVAKQLELAGYDVYKLGIDIPALTFVRKAQELKADIIGLSAFMVTTIPNAAAVIDLLNDMGIRDQHKVIIGGTETNQQVADDMGADGWSLNAVEAVKLCDRLMGHV